MAYRESQVHKKFVIGPFGRKGVRELPGIGPAHRAELEKNGITEACQVVGQFLFFKRDEIQFCTWMRSMCQVNAHEMGACLAAVKEWCDAST